MVDHHALILPEILHLSPRQLILEQALTEFLVSLVNKKPSHISSKKINRKTMTISDILKEEITNRDTSDMDEDDIIRQSLKEVITSNNEKFGVSNDKIDLFVNWFVDRILVKSGKRNKQEYAGFKPYHLKAATIYPKGWYILGPFLFSLLKEDPEAVEKLSEYFNDEIDLGSEYKALCNLIDSIDYDTKYKSDSRKAPLCKPAARALGEDIRKLLAYKDSIPRRVMTKLIQNCLFLHLAIYFLRIVKMINESTRLSNAGDNKSRCAKCKSINSCAYTPDIFVAIDKRDKEAFRKARDRLREHRDQTNLFVKNLIRLRKLYDFCQEVGICKSGKFNLHKVLGSRSHQQAKKHFKKLVRHYAQTGKITMHKDDVRMLLRSGSPLENYVNVLNRHHFKNGTRRHREWYEQVGSNHNQGFIRTGARGQSRFYQASSDLLKLLVLLITTEEVGNNFQTQSYLTIDEFCNRTSIRYGIMFNKWMHDGSTFLSDFSFIDENMDSLKMALTRLGMFRKQSDAATLQFIVPRYKAEVKK